jgi:hypothetical protein
MKHLILIAGWGSGYGGYTNVKEEDRLWRGKSKHA